MSSKQKSKHHYVPKLYLKRFANPETGNLLVHEYRNGSLIKTFNPSLNSIMCERGLYNFHPSTTFREGAGGQVHEDFMEDILFSRTYERIFKKGLTSLCDNSENINERTAWRIGFGILSLYLRNPVLRDLNRKFACEGAECFNHNELLRLAKFSELTGVLLVKLHEFLKIRAVFYRASGVSRFITSDHPPVPCDYDVKLDALRLVYKRYLHAKLLTSHSWPENIGLLCALSPDWCVFIIPISSESSIEIINSNDAKVASLNNFLSAGARRWIVAPYWFQVRAGKTKLSSHVSPVFKPVFSNPTFKPGSLEG